MGSALVANLGCGRACALEPNCDLAWVAIHNARQNGDSVPGVGDPGVYLKRRAWEGGGARDAVAG